MVLVFLYMPSGYWGRVNSYWLTLLLLLQRSYYWKVHVHVDEFKSKKECQSSHQTSFPKAIQAQSFLLHMTKFRRNSHTILLIVSLLASITTTYISWTFNHFARSILVFYCYFFIAHIFFYRQLKFEHRRFDYLDVNQLILLMRRLTLPWTQTFTWGELRGWKRSYSISVLKNHQNWSDLSFGMALKTKIHHFQDCRA